MNDPVSFIDTLTKILGSLMVFIPTLIGFMAMIAAILPPADPNSRWYPHLTRTRKIINILALNVKHARNKE